VGNNTKNDSTKEKRAADSPEVLRLVEQGLEMVDILARYMRRQFGSHVQLDDLASYGREALVSAARSYDPARQIPFHRWATIRIRGAMIDSVRQTGNLPKRVYRKLRALEAGELIHDAAAEDQAGAPPLTPEAADAQIDAQLATAAMAMAIGFLSMGNTVESAEDPEPSPESKVGKAQLVTQIREMIDERPEQERALLMRHYFQDVSLEEAGKELGLSKSWASRLHGRAIEAIAKSMKKRSESEADEGDP
jgi:RNA polymerase sigma factor for flagellar operon FliA